MTIISKLLTAYIWMGIITLIMLLYFIARFYQVTTNVRSHYRYFLLPAILFLGGMLRYITTSAGFTGDEWGDLFLFAGGVSLTLIGYFLLKLMTGGR